jgi:hypothetical protein
VALAVAALGAGCSGGSNGKATPPTTTGAVATTEATDAEATLRRAARAALDENFRLSVYVLWHNRVPASAQRSTRGPALDALRDAAADRRREGLRIRSLPGRYRIVQLQLDPSYTRATALVHDERRVAPYRDGRKLGRTIAVNDRAEIELRRLGNSTRFVVWRVTPVQ